MRRAFLSACIGLLLCTTVRASNTCTVSEINPHYFITTGDSKTYLDGWQEHLIATVNISGGHGYWTFWNGGKSAATANSYASDLAGILAGGAPATSPAPAADADGVDIVLHNIGVNDLPALPAGATWRADYASAIDTIHSRWPRATVYLMRPWQRGYDAEAATVAGWIATVQSTRTSWAVIGPDESVWLKGADNGNTNTSDGIHYSTPTGRIAASNAWQSAVGF